MRVIRNIIFDLDGTLADSKLGIINSQVYVFESVGVRVSEADLLRAIGQGWGLRKVFPHFLSGIDEAEIERLVLLYREHYAQTMMDFTTPFEGTLETLESLKARGFGLAVATLKRDDFARGMVQGIGAGDFISYVQGTQPGMADKPAPDVVLAACAGANWSPLDCLYVGDATTDIAAGRAAGTWTAGAMWDAYDREELIAAEPDFAFEVPESIPDALGQPGIQLV